MPKLSHSTRFGGGAATGFSNNLNKLGFMLAEDTTCVDTPPRFAKFGFTLAEVLITLGIIGIVAAMTIPNLIANYQKAQTATKLKKAISIVNQAYKTSFDEVGEASADEILEMGPTAYIEKYWLPYMKIALICKKYSDCGYSSNRPYKWMSGSNQGSDFINSTRIPVVTLDGMIFLIFTAQYGGGGKYTNSNIIWLDINGGKGPNVFGKDVFYLARVSDGKGVVPYCYSKSQQDIDSDCSSKGHCCAAKIKNSGWQISDDYPW